MGYYSKFKLTVDCPDNYNSEYHDFVVKCNKAIIPIPKGITDTIDKFAELEKALSSEGMTSYGGSIDDLTSGEGIKWYEHEADMKAFSKKFPEVLFSLEVNGEEEGDLSKKYFKNGKMQVANAKITYDEFDERKLK